MFDNLCLFLYESDRRGEEGSLGDGVPLEDCVSTIFDLFFSMDERFLILELDLFRTSFPMRWPSIAALFLVSWRILVSSRGMVCTSMVGCLHRSVVTWTFCRPVTAYRQGEASHYLESYLTTYY